MVDAPGVRRQIPPTMRDDELEVGVRVQHAAEYQMMNRDGRIERVADHIDQIMVSKAARLREAGRMHEDQHAQLFNSREDLAKALAREILSGHIGRDLDASEAQ